MINALSVTVPEIASDITDASIGPTHGVHKRPSDRPIKRPGPNPGFTLPLGSKRDNLENSSSMICWNLGIRREMPRPAITKTEKVRNTSEDIPLIFTIVERNKVKNVKLSINPTITPVGRAFPVSFPPIVEERIIGRTGRIQGDRIVTIPARNAKPTSNIIIMLC